MADFRQKSMWLRLVEVFLVVAVTVFITVILIYYNLNQTIQRMDTAYNSNIQLNDLSVNVSNIRESLYQYLNTKSTDALEDYYRYVQDYRFLLDGLNRNVTNNTAELAEKNIYRAGGQRH